MGRKKREFNRLRLDSGQHRRIMLVSALLGALAFLPVGLRLYSLMVTNYDYYSSLALRNQTRTTTVTADRGDIFDRNMNILATSVSVENVYLDPHELKQSKADIPEIARTLGEILGKDPAWIEEQAADIKRRYKQVGTRIDEETAGKSGITSMKRAFPASIWNPRPSGSTPMKPWRRRSSALPTRPTRAAKGWKQPTTASSRAARAELSPPKAITKWICPFPMKTTFPPGRGTA